MQKWLICPLIILSLLLFSEGKVSGQSPEDDWPATITTGQQARVTATVQDNVPPSTPILIAPENTELIRTGNVSFTWVESTDNYAVTGYHLYLDGALFLSNIPTQQQDNNLYRLTYDNYSGHYTLYSKSVIQDGNHTWRVEAFDAKGNTTSSVTWSFLIDSLSPLLLINNIGAQSVSISSHDTSTVPSAAIELNANQPLLKGTGEANSKVLLTAYFSNGRPPLQYEFYVDASGNWQLQLPILPRNVVFYLNFVIQDVAGNTSVIENVPVIIDRQSTPSSPPSTPISQPTQPPQQPTYPQVPGSSQPPQVYFPPGAPVVPQVPGAPLPPVTSQPPLLPQLSNLPPLLELPFHTAFEVPLPPLLNRAGEYFNQRLVAHPRLSWIYNSLLLLLMSLLFLIKLLALISPLKGLISSSVILSGIKTLLFFPFYSEQKKGLVFNSETGEPIAYAPLKHSQRQGEYSLKLSTYFTSKYGYIPDWRSNSEAQQLTVETPDYLFPSLQPKPEELTMLEFYKGDVLNEDESSELLFIPLDRFSDPGSGLRIKMLSLLSFIEGKFALTLIFIATLITLLFPSVLNLVSLLLYLLLYLAKHKKNYEDRISGVALDEQGTAVQFAVIRSYPEGLEYAWDFGISNKNGEYHLSLPPTSQASLKVFKPNWKLQEVDINKAILIQEQG